MTKIKKTDTDLQNTTLTA